MQFPDLGPEYTTTRQSLHRVAVHVLARARVESTGRFGLRVVPGGFGIPSMGPAVERLRVSGAVLIRERAGVEGSASFAAHLQETSIAELAAFAEVDLDDELSVGEDTPPLGDPNEPLFVDPVAADAVASWFAFVNRVLDQVIATSHALSSPSAVQLWPEHFDVAIDLAATSERRANVGGSPGDAFHSLPYLYVGPWTADRPGDADYWNAPFGAVLTYDKLAASATPVEDAVGFVHLGLDLLRG